MLDQLALAGLIPVIKVERAEDAVPLCRALSKGGLPVAEITFRTKAAEEAIRLVHQELPEVLLGAGTVLTPEQADKAAAAGAGYIVSPGLNPRVVRHCLQKGYPILPGCSSPSDIELALELGLTAVKFFPAEALGGINMIKALLGPFGGLKLVPTGGINTQNLHDYLSIKNVLACGGSWMVPDDAVKSGDWARVERLTAEAVTLMLGLQIRHIGINQSDAREAMDNARKLSMLTGWAIENDTDASCFIGTGLEMMKHKGRGTHGHIALSTRSIPRAMWHMERRGFAFDKESAAYSPAGQLRLIYLEGEFAGFGIHLSQI